MYRLTPSHEASPSIARALTSRIDGITIASKSYSSSSRRAKNSGVFSSVPFCFAAVIASAHRRLEL